MPALKKRSTTALGQVSVPKVVPELIHIVRIEMVRGHLDATDAFLEAPQRPDRVKVDFGHSSGIDWKGKRVRSRLFIELEGQDAQGDPIGVEAGYAFDFEVHVDNIGEFKVESENGPGIHGLLGNTLMGILFSTARGMVLERTKGTYLDGAILPVINPQVLLMNQRS